jgi:hypothetical protein
MPYVITTTRTVMGGYTLPGERESAEYVTRHAVATLDEARTAAIEATGGAFSIAEHEASLDAVAAFTESGGTVGPLPDGTVIRVARLPIDQMQTHFGQSIADACDAYNAAQEAVR